MEESTKRKVYQTEIIVGVVLVLVAVASLMGKPQATGFVSVETKKQTIDLNIANSQSYILTTKQEEPFHLTSLRLSGEGIGKGNVEVYLGLRKSGSNLRRRRCMACHTRCVSPS